MNRNNRWLLLGSILLPAVAWIGGAVYFFSKAGISYLEIPLTAESAIISQVFYDRGEGFREQDSVRMQVAASSELHRVRFQLPAGPIRALRFDPTVTSGGVLIGRAEIFSRADELAGHKRLYAEFGPESFVPAQQIERVERSADAIRVIVPAGANDPNLLMVLPKPIVLNFNHGYFWSHLALAAICAAVASRGLFWLGRQSLSGRLLPALLALGAVVGAWVASDCYFTWAAKREQLQHANAAFTALVAILALLTAGLRWGRSWVELTLRWLDTCARRLSSPSFMEFDRVAIAFCALSLVLFAGMVGAGLHGSSISMFGVSYGYWDNPHPPLLGTPKGIRNDEWAYHTPCILYQVFRIDQFNAEKTPLGPGMTSLMTNVPVRHVSELFRPNFWPFFVLPPNLAFSAYWQMKWLGLVLGSFSMFLLLTRSSGLAIFGSFWLLFSAHTQWTYSWSSLLPELIGYICLGTVLACYLLVGRNRLALALAALGLVTCAVSFACSLYVPHQLPLVVVGGCVVAWWALVRWRLVIERQGRVARLLALGTAGLATSLVLALFWVDLREVMHALMNTSYPGKRSLAGGALSLPFFTSDFLDFWKQEGHVPPQLSSISEGTGFFWLAPITLATLWPRWLRWTDTSSILALTEPMKRERRLAFVWLWVALGVLAAWTLLPVPRSVAELVLFDKVLWNRCLPAMGLANIAIVCTYLSMQPLRSSLSQQAMPARVRWPFDLSRLLLFVVAVYFCLLSTNQYFHAFFASSAVLLGTLYLAMALFFVVKRWRLALATWILVPHIYFYGLVQPIDRGLDQLTGSPLFRLVHGDDKRLRQERWLIYSRWIEPPGLFTAIGCEVFNGLKYVPPLDELRPFDPQGVNYSLLNQAAYFVAKPLVEESARSTFVKSGPNVITWSVSPLDPELKQRGIRFAAFDQLPDPAIRNKLKPLLPHAVNGFWLYELP